MWSQERGNTVITTKQMDARRLDFANNTFDVVIDKGLLDALTCGDGAHANINMMLEEAHRVLKPQGVFFCLSRAVESKRKGLTQAACTGSGFAAFPAAARARSRFARETCFGKGTGWKR